MPSNVEVVRTLYEEANRTGVPVEMSPYFSDDEFTLTTYPRTVGWPDMDKKGYNEYGNKVRSTTLKDTVKVVITELIDAGDKVIIHATAIKPMKDGKDLNMDRLRIYTFNEEGKIVHCTQFVDSLTISKREEKYKIET